MDHAVKVNPDQRYHLESLSYDQDERQITIEWHDGHVSKFPFIWLRHALFFPAHGRPEQADDAPCLIPELPSTPRVGSIKSDLHCIEIDWQNDGCRTRHELVWLRDNCISSDALRARRPLPRTWMGADAAAFRWFQADDLKQPRTKLELFQQLRDYGLAFVKDVPCEPGTISQIANHFGPIRRTHHGSLFSIRSLPVDKRGAGQNIGATASNAQAPHTDEGFRHNPLGIMFFHCLQADPSGGGASLFVDGIGAAEALRQSDPDAFDFLTTTPLIGAAERNPKERYRTRGRLIATDPDGVVRGVRVADRTMPPVVLPEAQIEPAYQALRAFFALLYDPQREFEHLLQPGEMVIFDNQRVLHARRAFDPAAGERHIQQVSVDREEFHSIFRQVAGELGSLELANWEPDAGVLS